jgi:hypothetical protein
MSWAPHLASHKGAGKGHIGLYGQDGVSWASTDGFPLSTADAVTMATRLFHKQTSEYYSGGLTVNSKKLFCVAADEEFVRFKTGSSCCVVYKHKASFHVFIFEEEHIRLADANIACDAFASYIKALGF